jgi:hypothetical protein
MKITQIYCDVDDFCRTFIPEWQKQQLIQGDKKRQRAPRMSYSEMLSILVCYQESGYRTFKWFYQRLVQVSWREAFPKLLSYNRFIELLPRLLVPLTAFMLSRCGSPQGIAFIDSTPLAVCKNIRIPPATKPSRNRPVAESRPRAGFMVLSDTSSSTTGVKSCLFA